MTERVFPGRVGLQQRVIPSYRAVFLDALAQACERGLSVFAGKPLAKEGIEPVNNLQVAQLVHARNANFLSPSSSLYICWQDGILKWLEELQPEVLIVEANPRYPTTRKAISWMHQKGRKVVGWGLGAPSIRGALASIRKRERLSLLQSLDAIIAYSQQGAEQYRQLGLPEDCVYIACNAADKAPQRPPTLRQRSEDGKVTVLFVGRLQSRKRVDLLLQACALLPHELQPHVIIVGDGPAREQFELIANQIYPGAEFVGAKHGVDIEPYFSQADLFVLPGTGGLAIQQAMAHGLPVIVAQGDGTQDDLVREENGWQVPYDDLTLLTATIQRALSDPDKLRQMGYASYKIVAEEINVDKMVEVFIHVLNNIYRQE